MQLLDTKIQKEVRKASKRLGIPERDVVNRAVSLYLGMSGVASLHEELRAWDVLSAKTMRRNNW
ncbi:hypothetical protein A3A38_04895 [Candidatus Kaiserbacteria bacterium RIFCSPLOWO2_01_FULL_53_17]|uniref:Ribbon-helix-helix protein CopG domain-containing protein n=1 Tax=Candidatus Kaiserbacteria bacterium RIFCSPLOWO2_01_FULL_53_17 TaxID=1798511 RepID=A0A1F6EHK0_9BACT|nr:MAG: hypothetical protein A3A38_04895 [Candidatus Kaiserbacteria bacterium RIFCSPLOWO2_01_FULL_53_17]